MSLDEGYRSASTEVRALAQRFGMEALAAAAVAGKIEVIARSAPSAWRTVGIEPGDFLAPPVGLVYMSWASESTFNEWLQASRPGTESDSAIYRAAAAVVRARGYAGGLENHPDELLQIMESLAEIHDERERKASARALLSLLRHGMSFITAPVFAPDGTVPLALTLFPPDDVSTTTHRELVDALLESCARLTAQIGGTTPPRR
jgi:DNA-binding IclR family transcriptional regulator